MNQAEQPPERPSPPSGEDAGSSTPGASAKPATDPRKDLTKRLNRWQQGSQVRDETLFRLIYGELEKIAHAHLKKGPQARPLETAELVNEAYIRLENQKQSIWRNRSHFYGSAAKLMRQVLVDALRARNAKKRGGGEPPLTFIEDIVARDGEPKINILALDEALTELEAINKRWAQIVEMRFFAGLTIEQVADQLDISRNTVKREWDAAKSWLKHYLDDKDKHGF